MLSYQYRTVALFREEAPFVLPIFLAVSFLAPGSEGVKQTVLYVLLIAQRERS